MATRISNIFIQGLRNKTYTCQFPTETFNETTISELKRAVLDKTGIGLGEQRLIYRGKTLETIRDGRKGTFGDYSLRDKSTIMLVMGLTGGAGSGFLPLRFADVSSEDSFKEMELITGGPEWSGIYPGINFDGTCKNRFCLANNEFVSIPRGFYDSTGGTCMLNYEITKLKCPVCRLTLDKNEVNAVGVFKAKLQVKSKKRGNNEVVVNIKAKGKFLAANCMDDKGKVDYEYVILTVKRF